LGGLSGF
jgi:hypothetical protein